MQKLVLFAQLLRVEINYLTDYILKNILSIKKDFELAHILQLLY